LRSRTRHQEPPTALRDSRCDRQTCVRLSGPVRSGNAARSFFLVNLGARRTLSMRSGSRAKRARTARGSSTNAEADPARVGDFCFNIFGSSASRDRRGLTPMRAEHGRLDSSGVSISGGRSNPFPGCSPCRLAADRHDASDQRCDHPNFVAIDSALRVSSSASDASAVSVFWCAGALDDLKQPVGGRRGKSLFRVASMLTACGAGGGTYSTKTSIEGDPPWP